jgi:hypothetical protein
MAILCSKWHPFLVTGYLSSKSATAMQTLDLSRLACFCVKFRHLRIATALASAHGMSFVSQCCQFRYLIISLTRRCCQMGQEIGYECLEVRILEQAFIVSRNFCLYNSDLLVESPSEIYVDERNFQT